MIKPNVLTHVIEGFVIQEADEPFAVTRQRYTDKETSEEPPSKYYLIFILKDLVTHRYIYIYICSFLSPI